MKKKAAQPADPVRCKICGGVRRHSKMCPKNPYFKPDARRKLEPISAPAQSITVAK